jgi:signal transduction histidine kinase
VGYNNESISIEVSDTGPGIPSEELSKIFTPFYRGTQGKRFVEGMGLGLSIANDVVQAHGGKLSTLNQPGRGASFIIELPLS